jgi:hypothetical protein
MIGGTQEMEPLAPGSVLGRYQIVRLLGKGGMGTVYEAVHRELRKPVAIKVLNQELADDPQARARLRREAEALARIDHEHVVDVSDVDTHAGLPFLVMEHLQGEDLAALLAREGALGVERTLELLLPVIAGVAAGHARGVIHRDLKPQNIFLAWTGGAEITPKVLDFGISKLLDPPGGGRPPPHQTGAGTVFGSAPYLSPEQARCAPDVGPASDQYALGAILYQCLTGQPPFPGASTFDVLRRVVQGRIAPLRQIRPEVPAALEVIVLRALSVDPGRRFPALTDLGRALLPFCSARCRARWASRFAGGATGGVVRSLGARLALGGALLAGLAVVIVSRVVRKHGGDGGDDFAAVASVPGHRCGDERPDISGIRETDALAIDRSGTLYFSQVEGKDGWLGRLRPGGAAVEPRWLKVPGGINIWGLAVDSDRQVLYVSSASSTTIYAADLTPPAGPRLRRHAEAQANDLALDFAGNLYYSDQRLGRVLRVAPGGQVSVVTAEPIGQASAEPNLPAGLAFAPGGDLAVGTTVGGVIRLELRDGREVSRRVFGKLQAWGNGLAFDARGRLYLAEFWPAERSIFRMEADGSSHRPLATGHELASLVFGRGALDCRDLYIASRRGPLLRLRLDARGLPLP